MAKFTWERGPFSTCSRCGQETLGILRAGGDSLTKRCTSCRHSVRIDLPPLDKRVIYLDQFVFSLLFNVQSDGRLPPGHEEFAKTLHQRLRRLVLLQQVILPHSNIHHDETTVFHSAIELRRAYEFIGGDVGLVDTHDVEFKQTMDAAKAFLSGSLVSLDFSVDGVLRNRRNEWLPDMHISVGTDYSVFADDLRRVRDETHAEMKSLADRWNTERVTFTDVLNNELNSIMSVKVDALTISERNKLSLDPMVLLNAEGAPIQREVREALRLMQESGVPQDEVGQKVRDFWSSDVNLNLPHHRISSYLFAAVARRVVQGQRKIINRGLINDIRAISCYAPYVDAMFIDRDCARLLQEEPLKDDLDYKARIFSFDDPKSFLDYLDEIESATTEQVAEYAAQIYGVRQ